MLNESSKELGIPRDQIIDSGVRLLRALLQKEREFTLEKHERAIVTLKKLSAEMLSTEAELESYLDEDDPILSRLNLLITVMDNLVNAVENELKITRRLTLTCFESQQERRMSCKSLNHSKTSVYIRVNWAVLSKMNIVTLLQHLFMLLVVKLKGKKLFL